MARRAGRTALVVAVAVSAGAVSAGSALGVARVGLGPAGDLAVAVNPGAGVDDAHGIIIEPFRQSGSDGFRVRQDALGRPPFVTSDTADCSVNPILNDVVCNGPRGSAGVTTFRGADAVTMIGQVANTPGCFAGGTLNPGVDVPPVVRATLALGGGDDDLVVVPNAACPPGPNRPVGTIEWSVNADGEGGNDELTGGIADDRLLGGFGLDTLRGSSGNDDLRGGEQRDVLDGGPGNDTVRGGDDTDIFQGGEGDDLLHGALDGAGGDDFFGGPGIDTVTYAFSSQGVVVTVAPSPNADDGRPGEIDELVSGVENVTGTQQADTLTGDAGDNQLEGLAGGDEITGGGGRDTLVAADGADAIRARDGIADRSIDCGPGADVAELDLQDRGSRGCEFIIAFATDDGPPGRLAQGVLRVGADGRARARFACPPAARVACRGVLRLQQSRPGGRVLARARYAVARGTVGVVVVEIPAGLRNRSLRAVTVERGVSKKGPRSSERSVRIR